MISDDKFLFSLVLGKVARVPQILAIIENGKVSSIANSGINNENLYDYLIEHEGVIKDKSGSDGFDVYVFNVVDKQLYYKNKVIDYNTLEKIVSSIQNGIVTTKITQGEYGNSLYPNSVNTVRVISVKKKNEKEHEIIGAVQRIGTNRCAPVDNFNQGGGSALIDIETGVLGPMTCIDSLDSEGKRIFWDNHPDTNAEIKGKQIPNWEQIKEEIINITREMPLWNYVAWDIVVQDDGMAIIETNMKSSLNLFQVHGGMRNTLLGKKYKEHGFLFELK